MTNAFIPKIEEKEHKNRIISASLTAVCLFLMMLLCFFWYAPRHEYTGIGEKEIEMVSGIGEGDGSGATVDYGDNREGNKDVNNFQPSTANPTPNPPSPAATEPKVAPAPAPKINLPAPPVDKTPLAGNEDSHVNVPVKEDKKDTKKDDKATASTKPDTKNNTQTSTSTPPDKNSSSSNSTAGGGSNHGKGGDTGNSGIPGVSALNLEGVQFGAGSGTGGNGGLNNRKPIKLTKPKYDVQEEGQITYKFIIEPDGTVSYVKALPNMKPKLASIGENTIKNEWKFDKLKGDNAQKQTVLVTITYKLKN